MEIAKKGADVKYSIGVFSSCVSVLRPSGSDMRAGQTVPIRLSHFFFRKAKKRLHFTKKKKIHCSVVACAKKMELDLLSLSGLVKLKR